MTTNSTDIKYKYLILQLNSGQLTLPYLTNALKNYSRK